MEPNDKDQRRKNLMVGWAIGAIAIVLYLAAIYSGVGKS
jgi:Coiled-coil domain-containing protein 56